MADLRIVDAPEILLQDVEDGLKLPTGGFGNYAITMSTISDWLVRYKDLALKSYVDSELSKKADTSYVDIELGKKANSQDVTNSLNTKEDKTVVTNLRKLGGVDYWEEGTYPLNGEVRLDNGGIVKSTVANNTNNPNVDMTGWVKFSNTINLSSVSEMLAIQSPNNGDIVQTTSYVAGKGKGGSFYIYDSSKASINNYGTIINGWCLLSTEVPTVRHFGAVGDGVTDDTLAIQRGIDAVSNLNGVKGDVYLVSRQYDDGTQPKSQFNSYSVKPRNTANCVFDLQGATIKRAQLGTGDNISMHLDFTIEGGAKLIIRNGIIDMNNQNARFARWVNFTKKDQGAEYLTFINTSNNGTPRTVLPESSQLISIDNGEAAWVRNCKAYVGSDNDLSGNATAGFDNPSFAVRITSDFVYKEEDQTRSTKNCYVKDCEFVGRFTWQAVEISGSGTVDCYQENIVLRNPILSMIDIDKGAKRCYAKNINIYNPDKGFSSSPDGGDGYNVIRFQGYWNSTNAVYADGCWADNIHIYGLKDSFGTASSGTLVAFSYAKNCEVRNVFLHDNDKEFWELVSCSGSDSLGNKLSNINGKFRRLNTQRSGVRFELSGGNLAFERFVHCASGTFLDSNDVSIVASRNKLSGYHTYKPNLVRSYDLTVGVAPTIQLIGNEVNNVNTLINTTTGFPQPNIKIIGNVSLNQVALDAYNSESTLYVGNTVALLDSEYLKRVTYDPPSIAVGGSTSTTVSLVGVIVGQVVQAAFSQYHADIEISTVVSDIDTVTVKFKNTGTSAVNLPSGTLTVKVI